MELTILLFSLLVPTNEVLYFKWYPTTVVCTDIGCDASVPQPFVSSIYVSCLMKPLLIKAFFRWYLFSLIQGFESIDKIVFFMQINLMADVLIFSKTYGLVINILEILKLVLSWQNTKPSASWCFCKGWCSCMTNRVWCKWFTTIFYWYFIYFDW